MNVRIQRAIVGVICGACVAGPVVSVTRAAPPAAALDEGSWPLADAAAGRGLAFLARQQSADGSFSGGAPPAAQTALTLTAFLACGHTPGAGKYGPTVRQAVDYLLLQSPADRYYGKIDKSRMYGQAAVTLALSQACGVETDPLRGRRMRVALERAVGVILKSQQVAKDPANAGGWRYDPTSADSDLSVTSWCLLALRSAGEAGVPVPREAIDRGLAYVRTCYHPGRKAFSYQPGKEPSAAMTAAAILCLTLNASADGQGKEGAEQTAAAAKYLTENRVHEATPYPAYATYITAHAALQEGGAAWVAVWENTRKGWGSKQAEDGGWPASRSAEEPGRVYATTMAVLALSTPYRMLPAFEK